MRIAGVGVVALAVLGGCGKAGPAAPPTVATGAAQATAAATPEAKAPEAAPEAKEPEAKAPEAAPEAKPAEVEPPEAVAKRYVTLGGDGGDLEAARKLVDPRCQNDKVWEVDAAKMMGARLTLESVEITVTDKSAASATVQTHLKGSVHAKKVDDTVNIGGKPAQIKVGGMEMSGASLSESLALALVDGRWVVTCAAAR